MIRRTTLRLKEWACECSRKSQVFDALVVCFSLHLNTHILACIEQSAISFTAKRHLPGIILSYRTCTCGLDPHTHVALSAEGLYASRYPRQYTTKRIPRTCSSPSREGRYWAPLTVSPSPYSCARVFTDHDPATRAIYPLVGFVPYMHNEVGLNASHGGPVGGENPQPKQSPATRRTNSTKNKDDNLYLCA